MGTDGEEYEILLKCKAKKGSSLLDTMKCIIFLI